MKRSRMLVLATVALVLSMVVTIVVYKTLRDRAQPTDDIAQIVVMAHDVSIGERLTAGDLRLAPWPRAVTLKGTFHDIADVVGRGVVIPMIANEPLLDSKLAAAAGGAGLSSAIPEGMRAVGVKVDDVIGVSGFVVPGSFVDVILSGSPDPNHQTEMAKVILENIQVLAAGQNVTRDGDGKPMNVQVVTLLVTPDDSQKLALASVEGKTLLSLRNPMDKKAVNPVAVNRDGLYGSSAPASLPTAPERRAVRARPAVVEAVQQASPAPAPVIEPRRNIDMQLIQGTLSETVRFETRPKP